jgi:hypothetical protein
MTKVNLLPDYIWEGKRRRQTWILVFAGLLLELAALGFFVMSEKANLNDLTATKDELETKANDVTKIEDNAKNIASTIQPITDKTKFIEDVLNYDKRFPALFERTNMYTSSRVGYRQMQPAQTVLNLSAYARNVSDIGRYLLNIQRAKDVFTTVSITSQMPGWPAGSTGATGGAIGPAGTSGPYGPSPSGPYGPSPAGPYGPSGVAVGGLTGASDTGIALADTGQAQAPPPTIDFTAVGQLTQTFAFTPPVYAAAGASADQTGGYGSAAGPYGPSVGPYGPGAGAPPGAPGGNGGPS